MCFCIHIGCMGGLPVLNVKGLLPSGYIPCTSQCGGGVEVPFAKKCSPPPKKVTYAAVPVLISLLFRAVHISAIFISPPMPPQPHIPPLHAFCPILRGMPKKSSQLKHKNESHKLGRKNVHLLVAGYNRTPPPHIDKEVNGP